MMGVGQPNATVMVVGECLSQQDALKNQPFGGSSGKELARMLEEAGILWSECYFTNLVNRAIPRGLESLFATKKKDLTASHIHHLGKDVLPEVMSEMERLFQEIDLVKPNIIVTLGNGPLWALTGAWGYLKWRGSQLWQQYGGTHRAKVIPTVHPNMIFAQWELRAATVLDLKRAARERNSPAYNYVPEWNFQVRPSATLTLETLHSLTHKLESGELEWIDFDLETRAGHIACAGISWSKLDALCIPLMCVENKDGYWEVEEEADIVFALMQLLTHPKVKVRGQNLLYDCQYTYRHWHFVPRVAQDTMISHHTLFAGLPKRLDYQASMYCEHYVYWKDDGKTWTKDVGEDQLWEYNCQDCVRTRECGEVELAALDQMNLTPVDEFQQKLFWPVLKAMQLGVRIDQKARNEFAMELQEEMVVREEFFKEILGHPLNPRSSHQMIQLFYNDLGIPAIMSKGKKNSPAHVTCDDKALELIMKKEPLAIPLVRAIQEYRSLGVFLSTFVMAPLDIDGRMRCSFNICGTETYRFSSSANAFGSGTNLQNIPNGSEEGGLNLPNVRKLFIPDPGFTFFDMDLDRADLQVVVWEADDEELKAALRMGVDMHLLNAYTLSQKELPPLEELVESHPRYPDHRIPYKRERQLAKSFIHGTNYGGSARTMAQAAGVTVHQADRFQKIYFDRYPGLKRWHQQTEEQLRKYRFVENKFGYRRYYFDRVDKLLPEALAWIPQSTVANYIDKIWLSIYENIPEVQVLIQVHDSLCGQFPTHLAAPLMRRIQEEAAKIIIPYSDPLIIPVGINTSEKSWGHCK